MLSIKQAWTENWVLIAIRNDDVADGKKLICIVTIRKKYLIIDSKSTVSFQSQKKKVTASHYIQKQCENKAKVSIAKNLWKAQLQSNFEYYMY